MKFVFTNKGNFETDIITDILKSENIRYQIKSTSPFHNDISIDTSYEHFLFVKGLANKKLEPYVKAEISYALPEFNLNRFITVIVEEKTPIQEINELNKELEKYNIEAIYEIEEKPKKSKLQRLIEWFKNV